MSSYIWMHWKTLFCILFTLVIVPGCLNARQGEYELKLGRHFKAFDQYRLLSSYSDTIKLVENSRLTASKPLYTSARSIALSADADVVSTTVDGQEREKKFVIVSASINENDESRTLLRRGTEVSVVYSDTGSVFKIAGKEANDTLSMLLNQTILSLGGSKTAAILDCDSIVRLHDEWAVNERALIESFGLDPELYAGRISGFVRLIAIDTVNNGELLTVEAKIKMPAFSLPDLGLGPAKDSKMLLTITICVPADSRYPIVSLITKTDIEAHYTHSDPKRSVTFHARTAHHTRLVR